METNMSVMLAFGVIGIGASDYLTELFIKATGYQPQACWYDVVWDTEY